MPAARIATVFFAALLLVAGAQLPSQTWVTIQVTDTAGNPVTGALVDAALYCDRTIAGETDTQGKFSFAAKPRPWYGAITVTASGLCTEVVEPVNILDQSEQIISVKLESAGPSSKGGPACTFVEPAESAQPNQGRTTVQVADFSGGVIPKAQIEIDPSPTNARTLLAADSEGRASIDLPAGIHTLTVTSRGSSSWTHKIEITDSSPQTIYAVLQVQNCGDQAPFNPDEWGYMIELPGAVFLSPEPFQNLAPLPSQRLKKHWW